MPKFKKILSPIQFNDPNSLVALDLARQLALEGGAQILLMHVIPPNIVVPDPPWYQGLFAVDEPAVKGELERIAGAHLRDVSSVQFVIKRGDPADKINQAARELDADLIVMATHGRRGMSRFFMGSVAEKVVREAPCMVLTIRPELREKDSQGTSQG